MVGDCGLWPPRPLRRSSHCAAIRWAMSASFCGFGTAVSNGLMSWQSHFWPQAHPKTVAQGHTAGPSHAPSISRSVFWALKARPLFSGERSKAAVYIARACPNPYPALCWNELDSQPWTQPTAPTEFSLMIARSKAARDSHHRYSFTTHCSAADIICDRQLEWRNTHRDRR